MVKGLDSGRTNDLVLALLLFSFGRFTPLSMNKVRQSGKLEMGLP
jgi:hypothetical protein